MKNVETFHGASEEALAKLPTRQLLAMKNATYGRRLCDCGCCQPRDDEDAAFNGKQCELQERVIAVLSTREHIPNKKEDAGLMPTTTAAVPSVQPQPKPTRAWVRWALHVRRNGYTGCEAAVGGHPLRPLNGDRDLLAMLGGWHLLWKRIR